MPETMRLTTFAVSLWAAIFAATASGAVSPPTIEWTRPIGPESYSTATGVAAAASGGAYVVGSRFVNPEETDVDAYLARYDGDGTQLWKRGLTVAGFDQGRAVAVDEDGFVFISGYTSGVLNGVSAGNEDAFVAKLDADGNLIWGRQLGSTRSDAANAVASDRFGGVYIAGSTFADSGGAYDSGTEALLSRFDGAGMNLWTVRFGSSSDDACQSVASDLLGNVYVSGVAGYLGSAYTEGSRDFIAKYSSAGERLWLHQLDGVGLRGAWGVCVDDFGNAYLTGDESHKEEGGQVVEGSFLQKYDSVGNVIWTTQFGVRGEGRDIELDDAGNVYVSGTDKYEAYVRKFTTDGELSWYKLLPLQGIATGDAISVAPDGSVYMADTTVVFEGPASRQRRGRVVKLAVAEPGSAALAAVGVALLTAGRRWRLRS